MTAGKTIWCKVCFDHVAAEPKKNNCRKTLYLHIAPHSSHSQSLRDNAIDPNKKGSMQEPAQCPILCLIRFNQNMRLYRNHKWSGQLCKCILEYKLGVDFLLDCLFMFVVVQSGALFLPICNLLKFGATFLICTVHMCFHGFNRFSVVVSSFYSIFPWV
jgi:hypothetical protein